MSRTEDQEYEDVMEKIRKQLPYIKALLTHIKIIENTEDSELLVMSFEAIEKLHQRLHGTNDARTKLSSGWGNYERIRNKYLSLQ